MYEVILTGSSDGPMIAFEASTGAILAQFTGSRSPCRGFTVTCKELIVTSHVSSDNGSGSIHIYNWDTSTVFHKIPLPEVVTPIIANSSGDFLFAGGVAGSIHSLSLPSGDIIKSITPYSKPVSSLHLNNDGSLLISGYNDGSIVVIPSFMLVNGSSSCNDPISHKWKAHSDAVTSFNTGIGIHTCTFVSCSMDCTCKFWSLSNGITLIRTVTFPCSIFGFIMDSTESGFYAAGSDGFIYKGLMKVGSIKMLEKSYELVNWGSKTKNHGGSIMSLVLVNNGRNLVSASKNGSVWMWDVEEGEVIMVLGNAQILGSISDMIVVKGTNIIERNECGEGSNSGLTSSSRLCDEEMVRTWMKISELENVMDEAVHDQGSAIDMLESTIASYERLLKLILREVTKAIEEADHEDEDNDNKGEKD
ncbi:protein ROOT INITIATION DEFECTIVE 3-like [Vicia villosa]|uniref:protein ROOT INITIATION DEFECTIVE 3-like n=1 Tax=Vicia villosa TaxID=3911 RepID=UPI00273B10F9|nr:protein ROOT INITIATION DEFECTIVE 3-like [Vicia villosa]